MSTLDLQQALTLIRQGNTHEAIALLTHLIDAVPFYTAAHVALAYAYELAEAADKAGQCEGGPMMIDFCGNPSGAAWFSLLFDTWTLNLLFISVVFSLVLLVVGAVKAWRSNTISASSWFYILLASWPAAAYLCLLVVNNV